VNVTEDAGALNISILEVARPDFSRPIEEDAIHAMALALGLMWAWAGDAQGLVDQRLRRRGDRRGPGCACAGRGAFHVKEGDQSGKRAEGPSGADLARAEAYRTVRTAVYFGLPEARQDAIDHLAIAWRWPSPHSLATLRSPWRRRASGPYHRRRLPSAESAQAVRSL